METAAKASLVALRKESVDRNSTPTAWYRASDVALRKESVDRNSDIKTEKRPLIVALRKESVDRNDLVGQMEHKRGPSLSARRAWIEIAGVGIVGNTDVSLSARRAWIEIQSPAKEAISAASRSPQGERG